ncbi:MAG: OmpA family protein [Pseudomonadota bacterium]|nr:OmpA family protein [Pseudomonadota bacterium]
MKNNSHLKAIKNRMPAQLKTTFITAFCLLSSACSIQYADPYYGYLDETKSFKTEGFIATMNQGGPFVRHPKKPERWRDFEPYRASECAQNPGNQPKALRRLLDDIHDEMPGFKTTWSQQNTKLQVEIPQDSIFFVDAPHLRPDAYARLDTMIDILSPFNLRVDFVGHTDSTGSDAYNNTLSAQRALHLQRYFVLKGLPKHLSTSHGLGESVPIATNKSVSGRKINRRVTLLFCTIE